MVVGKCEICNVNGAKYKCPKCIVKFCSVGCFKTHKEKKECVKQEADNQPEEKKEIWYEYETEDTVPLEKLRLLETDENIKKNLENPFLRKLLTKVNYSQNPDTSIEDAMQEPEFVDFVTHCLKTVEDQSRYEKCYNS
ncbi:zinc finger HIT domain-containing protein 3 [Parasteatoda tepidariorum]|uniref:zinc finger HIT domain-containing protein 3 n=1 Tax=Parasteatoda tepidariorum TaxID=114398 RepID=UPI00077FB309|nr:zinc finger HIT domain-containing protein 3 isoform X1 [Parasteatoda tepidariorum]